MGDRLDKVVSVKEKEIADLQKQIGIFKRELEDVFDKLKNARSELSVQAKKTVNDLDERIPILIKSVAEYEAEIKRLDSVIFGKKAETNEANKTLEAYYKNLEKTLRDEISASTNKVNERNAEIDRIMKGHLVDVENLKAREGNLEYREKVLKDAQTEHQKKADAFAALAEQVQKDQDEVKRILTARSKEIDARAQGQEVISDKLTERENAVAAQERRANEIIAREREVMSMIDKVNAETAYNKEITAQLDERKTLLNSEIKRLAVLKDRLTDMKYKIDEREKNIKAMKV
jgi:chromosome segregation ATPase